jgi:hypothetical protein
MQLGGHNHKPITNQVTRLVVCTTASMFAPGAHNYESTHDRYKVIDVFEQCVRFWPRPHDYNPLRISDLVATICLHTGLPTFPAIAGAHTADLKHER